MGEKEDRAEKKFLEAINTPAAYSGGGYVSHAPIGTKRRHPLLEEMKSLNIKQVDAASLLNITHGNLNHYLNGYRFMPTKVQEELTLLCKMVKEREDE